MVDPVFKFFNLLEEAQKKFSDGDLDPDHLDLFLKITPQERELVMELAKRRALRADIVRKTNYGEHHDDLIDGWRN